MAQEVEIKFRIDDLQALAAKLRDAGFQLVTPRTHEINTLYDLRGGPLRSQGSVLRIRKYGEQFTLTFKSKGEAGRHKSRQEIETRLENGENLAAIFEALGFRPSFQYEKFRTEWADHQGHVVIDETPIGSFGEIEGPPEWIDKVAHRLGIAEDQYITDSYAVLFTKWKDETRHGAKNMLFAEV